MSDRLWPAHIAHPNTFDVPSFSFDARDARDLRVTGTSLQQIEESEYRMQLAEIEVFTSQPGDTCLKP